MEKLLKEQCTDEEVYSQVLKPAMEIMKQVRNSSVNRKYNEYKKMRNSSVNRKYNEDNSSEDEDLCPSIHRPMRLRPPFVPTPSHLDTSVQDNESFGLYSKKLEYSESASPLVKKVIDHRRNLNFRAMTAEEVITKIFEPFEDSEHIQIDKRPTPKSSSDPFEDSEHIPIDKRPTPKSSSDLDTSSDSDLDNSSETAEQMSPEALLEARRIIEESQEDMPRSLYKHGIDPYAHMRSCLEELKAQARLKAEQNCNISEYEENSDISEPEEPTESTETWDIFQGATDLDSYLEFTPLKRPLNDSNENLTPEVKVTKLSDCSKRSKPANDAKPGLRL